MKILNSVCGLATSVALLSVFATDSQAASINYEGTLSDGVSNSGSISSGGAYDDYGAYRDPEAARYWQFSGNAGDSVTLEVSRQEQDLDPALWVFEGTFSDTSTFGNDIDYSDPGYLEFADDENWINSGPYGDPVANLTLPSTGDYTAIVTNYLSGPDDGGDGAFDYQITANGVDNVEDVPEPASILGLLTVGAVGFGTISRRKNA
jgi:hypothetical protein